ncbi:enoyl-CoA hydratase/isomerase family protein [Pseudomonas schmalbachii]|uniref:Enoyl-CoA hydratase/isomerase family protein n=1 Tax=Pseudomonas schmalbachii TaxID=2816993 RepID=A0ABS3TM99_9PSED|nr:enoyl-CoA hydratase/isomerase family protein [Pseudomonas schmalbachii]MBO3274786.1 enoyl-CoA hydratase/isomerase family protein [Pseudomonas schmalbachii]
MTCIAYHRQDVCAVLTLNRPEALNAISDDLLDELEAHLERIAADDSRALVITGAGRAFCAGSDLKSGSGDAGARIRRMHRLAQRLRQFPKISVAAINGFALGGGLEIALGCTFRVCAAEAKLGLPEIKLGVLPVYGGTQLLPRLIGEQPALRMMLSGEPVDSRRALELGLVDEVVDSVDEVLDAACRLAAAHSRYGLKAQQAIRRAVQEGLQLPLDAALELEAGIGQEITRTHDAQEGIRAFVEKRKPVFRDC